MLRSWLYSLTGASLALHPRNEQSELTRIFSCVLSTSFGKIVAESKYAADVASFTPLIKARNSTQIRVLLTNTTQEAGVLAQAATAATAFSTAWTASGAAESTDFPAQLGNVAAKVFRELIDVTTDIEVQYVRSLLLWIPNAMLIFGGVFCAVAATIPLEIRYGSRIPIPSVYQ